MLKFAPSLSSPKSVLIGSSTGAVQRFATGEIRLLVSATPHFAHFPSLKKEMKGMELPNQFKRYVGHLVRIVFKDGETTCAKCGKLLAVEGGFLDFETYVHRYLINVSQVLKIQDATEAGP
jgi:hypothetical protein